MEDLEPELVIIEEHENCRKSNQIQFLLSKQCVPFWKATLGVKFLAFAGQRYKLPLIVLDDMAMGGIRELKDFIRCDKEM